MTALQMFKQGINKTFWRRSFEYKHKLTNKNFTDMDRFKCC